MTRSQWSVVAICLALNFIDSYDVLVLAFSSAHIQEQFLLSGTELGVLLSAALLGMTLGALFVAQIADHIGRRKTIVLATIVIALGMFGSAMATDYYMLLGMRILTGIAVGTMQTSLNVLVAEYSNAKRRSTAVAIYSTGQPIGGVLGGAAVAFLLMHFTWHMGFIVGGVITLVMVPVVLLWLPESIDYLDAKRPVGALEKINAILGRMKQNVLDVLPEQDGSETKSANIFTLFKNGQAKKTLLLAFAFMMIMGSFYFANSWTPKLVQEGGYSVNSGISAGVMFSLGCIIGSLIVAVVGDRFAINRAVATYSALAAVSFAIFGVSTGNLFFMTIAAIILGMLTNMAVAGMFSIGPVYFNAAERASGVGLIGGIGRAGGMVSPIVAGALIDAGWLAGNISFVFIIPLLLGSVALLLLKKPQSAVSNTPGPDSGIETTAMQTAKF